MNQSCFYCEKDAALKELMIEVTNLQASTFYLNKDQTHKGRSILAFIHHRKELFELTALELQQFTEDIAKGAKAIQEAFGPQKINYAIYGDLVSHLHVHLVPKYQDQQNWGEAFINSPPQKKLASDAEYGILIEKLIKHLKIEGDYNE